MLRSEPLITAEQIQARVRELADSISEDYKGKDILVVGVLKGAFMFFSDLVRFIKVPLRVDFIIASSYLKTETTGDVKIHYDIKDNISDDDVILVDDIVDTGITLNQIRQRLLSRSPRSLKVCVLLDKKERRKVVVPIDYKGFEIPDVYVVGYGLDYEGRFRNLPYISVFGGSDIE